MHAFQGKPPDPLWRTSLTPLIVLGILLLTAFLGLRELNRAFSKKPGAPARRPLIGLGLLALVVLASRLGWAVPTLLGTVALAAIRLAPLLAPLLRRASAAPESGEAPRPPPGGKGMSKQEAYEILGLSPGASREEIIAAHRRLMQKMHPDRGGSDYLAGKINQARKRLLAR